MDQKIIDKIGKLSHNEADKIHDLAEHLDACIEGYGGIPNLPRNSYNQLGYLDICLLGRLFNNLEEWEFWADDVTKKDIRRVQEMYESLGNQSKRLIPHQLRQLLENFFKSV